MLAERDVREMSREAFSISWLGDLTKPYHALIRLNV